MAAALSHLLWVLLMLPPPAFTQTPSTIKMGSTLSTNQNSSWVSPSGEFAFGFHPLGGRNLFLLAIWFDKIPEKTIVWSANGDGPVQEGSKVELSNGQLVLNDHQGRDVWRAASNGTATSAAMLDTGNFVLLGSGSVYIWESFAHPTDTILPNQPLRPSMTLSSCAPETNYSSGRFRLRLQEGNLELYTVALPSKNPYEAYWSSNTADGAQVVFNQTGYIYLALKNGSRFNLTKGNMVSTREFYQRATLDYDGVFRQYIYQKNQSNSGLWGESWSPMLLEPPDICLTDPVNLGGVCGFNSYCKLDGDKPRCLCPTRYIHLDMNNAFKGCKPDFIPESCGTDGSEFVMEEMINTDWPLSDFETIHPWMKTSVEKLAWETVSVQ